MVKSVAVSIVFSGLLCAAPSLARVPLSFEPGVRSSEFVAHVGGASVVLTPLGAAIGEGRMRFIGARAAATGQAEEQLAGYTNYLTGRDRSEWRTHVPNYRRVRYRNIYPGIDVVYYGNPRELEFDFVVAPGADPRRIQLALSGPDLRVRLPRIYQEGGEVKGRAVRRGNRVTFELETYDRSQPLIIDPVLSYAALFGGGQFDEGRAIAVDSTGAAYVAGNTFSGNFPAVNGKPGRLSFVAKISPAGDALIYSTYIASSIGGGTSSYAVDASGSVYMTRDGGAPFPAIGPAPLRDCGIALPDVFVVRLSPDGTAPVYAGCIGGTMAEFPSAIAADAAGNAYVTGLTQSPDFPLLNAPPATPPAANSFFKGFVLKLRPDGALAYSRLLGGGSADITRAIAVDQQGNAYLTGQTSSLDFPLKNALQSRPQGAPGPAAFVVKINPDGSDFVYSTYLTGSSGDFGSAIVADASGNAYVTGSTFSADFPTTGNALQQSFHGGFLYRTTDDAGSWFQFDFGLPGPVTRVRVDPRNAANVYAVSSDRLFRSNDRGATWHLAGPTGVTSLWIDPVDSTVFATGPGTPLLRSRNAGSTFTSLNAAPTGSLNQMVFHPSDASLLYGRWGGTGQGDGIFKSTDGGDTWKPTGLTKSGTGSGALVLDPAHPATLYATRNQNGSILQSTDGGDTWNPIANFAAVQMLFDSEGKLWAVSNGLVFVRSGDSFVRKNAPASVSALAIDPRNSSVLYALAYDPTGNLNPFVPFLPTPGPSSSNIYKSSDGGDTWQPVNNGLPDARPITSLEVDPGSPGLLYVGMFAAADGFVAKLSADGSSLQYSSYLGGRGVDSINAIVLDPDGNAYVAGVTNSTDFPMRGAFQTGKGGFLTALNARGGLLWSTSLGETIPAAVTIGPAATVYLAGSSPSAGLQTRGEILPFVSGDFFRTSDGGATWSGATITALSPPMVNSVLVDPQNPSRVFALGDRLYVSDAGQSWTKLGAPGAYSSSLAIDPLTPSNIYAAGPTGFWKSTDGGVTWSQPRGASDLGGPVFTLTIDPKSQSTLYVTGFGANGTFLARSADSGATWKVTTVTPNAISIVVDPQNPAVVYASLQTVQMFPPPGTGGPPPAGPTGYLARSSDGGATWTTLGNGLPSGWFASKLVPDPATPGRIYAVGTLAGTELYRSDNGGESWIRIGSGLSEWQLSVLAIDPTKASVLYASSYGGGLYRSTDAGASFALVPGLRIPVVTSIAIDPSNPMRIYAGAQTNPRDVMVMKIAQ